MITHEVAVKNGAQLLDEAADKGVIDKDWRNKIDLRKFNMSDPCRCVLGQLHGDYYDAVRKLFGVSPGGEWAVEYGFEAPDIQHEVRPDDEVWDDLEREWVLYLKETR